MTVYGDNPTSYFSVPSNTLDPKLFQGRTLQDWARKGVLSLLQDYLQQKFRHADLWTHAWLAGSGVSYQWSADRQPGDLDCLVGVDFVQFRRANPEYAGLTDTEISEQINEGFREELQPQTENWNGYELTFYVNPGATDIRAIKPYAAYDLKYNEWTVTPDPFAHAPENDQWDSVVNNDYHVAAQIHTRFTAALNELSLTHAGPQRRNAEARVESIGQQGESMYDEIHQNRSEAFQTYGEGYNDFHNYRWQGGKRTGAIDLLREIRKHVQDARYAKQMEAYGAELPDANTLIRRAALYRNQ